MDDNIYAPNRLEHSAGESLKRKPMPTFKSYTLNSFAYAGLLVAVILCYRANEKLVGFRYLFETCSVSIPSDEL